jgi:transposase
LLACAELARLRLNPVRPLWKLEVLRLLVDRRRSIGEEHTRKVSQLHALLLELLPGGAKKDLSAAQARKLLASVRPRDVVGKTRKRVAVELVADLERLYARKKAANKELTELIKETGTGLLQLKCIGPSGAARLLVGVGDITRFPDRNHFASWTATAPIDASSGDHVRQRLSRGGNRQINGCCTYGHRSAAQPHRRSRLFRPQEGHRKDLDGSDALPQTQTLRHRLPHHARRSRRQRGDGPGRTPGKRL